MYVLAILGIVVAGINLGILSGLVLGHFLRKSNLKHLKSN